MIVIWMSVVKHSTIVWLPFAIFSANFLWKSMGNTAGKTVSCCLPAAELRFPPSRWLFKNERAVCHVPGGNLSSAWSRDSPLPCKQPFESERAACWVERTPLVGCANGEQIPKIWAPFLQLFGGVPLHKEGRRTSLKGYRNWAQTFKIWHPSEDFILRLEGTWIWQAVLLLCFA